MQKYFEKLRTHILKNPPDFGDGESVLTLLYEAYAESNKMDDGTIKDLTLALPADDAIIVYLTAELVFDNVDIVEFGNCAIEVSYVDNTRPNTPTVTFNNCTVTHKNPSAAAYLMYVGAYSTTFTVTDTTTNAAFAKAAAGGAVNMTVNNVTRTDGAEYVIDNGCTSITVTDKT